MKDRSRQTASTPTCLPQKEHPQEFVFSQLPDILAAHSQLELRSVCTKALNSCTGYFRLFESARLKVARRCATSSAAVSFSESGIVVAPFDGAPSPRFGESDQIQLRI
jgi:hypothetical protein